MSEIEFIPEDENIEFTPDRSRMDVEFYDQPKPKVFEVDFGGVKIEFRPDNCYAVVYRYAPEYNRIAYLDSGGKSQNIFNTPDLLNWMVGMKWDEHHTEMTRNGQRDSMYDLCGWTCDLLLKDRPDPEEKAEYELAQCYDLYPLGELTVQQIVEIGEIDD